MGSIGGESEKGLTAKLARCFTGHRLPEGITHTLPDLLRQRIFGLAPGYEDLIDHEPIRCRSSIPIPET